MFFVWLNNNEIMSQIIIFSAISALSLLLGAVIGLAMRLRQKTIAGLMAFAAGVLICALTFGLMEEAFRHGGFDAVIIGFLTGGLVFIGADYLVHRRGGRRHKPAYLSSQRETAESSGTMMTIGAILDGIPEAIALGITLATGTQGLLMLVAIALNNFPEAISSVPGLQKEGVSKKKILLMWTVVALVIFATAILSFQYLSQISLNTIGILEAFAAGAILAMLADTVMPEAYEEGGFITGLVTVLGFLVAFVVSRI